MLRILAEFWSELQGSIHPNDESEFRRFPDHGFNLEFPPPAFVGDVINAPVLILDNNGGYDAARTPREFPGAEARDEYRDMLANPRPISHKDRTVSPYYLSRNYSRWLVEGTAALVNGVAYRSVDGKAKNVERLTRSLPSALFHQRWLHEEVLPMADRGERFVVVHRWTRWNGAAEIFRGHRNAIFSSAPVSKDLTKKEIASANDFLRSR